MYLNISNQQYPCRERRVENNNIIYLGAKNLQMPISGVIQLCRNGSFITTEDDSDNYSRHILQGTRLTLTNEP